MSFKVRYYAGQREIENAEDAESLEQARRMVDLKMADITSKAEIAMIFRISPSGTEELEQSRRLRS